MSCILCIQSTANVMNAVTRTSRMGLGRIRVDNAEISTNNERWEYTIPSFYEFISPRGYSPMVTAFAIIVVLFSMHGST